MKSNSEQNRLDSQQEGASESKNPDVIWDVIPIDQHILKMVAVMSSAIVVLSALCSTGFLLAFSSPAPFPYTQTHSHVFVRVP